MFALFSFTTGIYNTSLAVKAFWTSESYQQHIPNATLKINSMPFICLLVCEIISTIGCLLLMAMVKLSTQLFTFHYFGPFNMAGSRDHTKRCCNYCIPDLYVNTYKIKYKICTLMSSFNFTSNILW